MNDQVLANVTDTDRVYRAVMDHAYGQLENAAVRAMQPVLDPGANREFLCGRVQALAEFIQSVENTRAKARELMIEQQRKDAARRNRA